jgi:2-polyprenyl-3-methyl-5-hydroxy-6-metoxy-1,4-benzoquinol methylase
MLKYLTNIVTSNNPNLFFLQLLLILAIVFLSLYLYRISESPYSKKNKALEGFTQEQPYVLKQNQNIYDDFYAEMYDGVHDRNKICQRELFQIVKMSEATTANSVFLEVGSATGTVLNHLSNAGYTAYGIDKSDAMVTYTETMHPELNVKKADVLDPMTYENGLFTHVLCLNFMVYEFENKRQFFSNCYYWMKSNAYLIVHLVNPSKFSTKKYLKFKGLTSTLFDNLLPESSEEPRVIELNTEFADCKYNEKYDFSKTTKIVTFTQIFTDNITKNIRQNEQTLHMESIDEILDVAKKCGFIVHAKTSMKGCNGDDNQYLYVLERAM